MGRKKETRQGFWGEKRGRGYFTARSRTQKEKKTGDHKIGGNQAKKPAKIFGKRSVLPFVLGVIFLPELEILADRFPIFEIYRFDPSTSIKQSGFGREKEGMEAATARTHKNSWIGRSERK